MKTFLTTIVFLAAASGAAAQGPHGAGAGMRNGAQSGIPGSALVMTNLRTVAGAVTAVSIGYGMQYPAITVNQIQIKVAPAWYLLDKDFEIKAGDNLSIVAAPSAAASDPYLYAVEITNTATKSHIVLRDSNGAPLWSRRGGGPGAGYGSGTASGGNCVEIQAIATESGVVEQVTAGPGIQMPSLTLKTAAGKLLAIKLGPERIFLETDLELKAGDSITVKYAVTLHDELVAIAITKGGVTITLRGEDCRPVWNRG